MKQKFQTALFRKKHLYSFLFSMLCVGITTLTASALIFQKLLSANKTEQMRATLLRAISHDLRTPLCGIINNSSLLLEQREHLTDYKKQLLISNIYEDSEWLLHMVENLLTITRIQGHDQTISLCTTSEPVEEVIAEALQKLSIRFPDVEIHVKMPEDFILLSIDAVLIEQVLINLLTNAILHAHSARPIELLVYDQPHAVSFTVRDYGTGIPSQNIKKLSRSSKDGCSGLGLSICQTIIAAHHGSISCRNHAEGAEFTFTLPKDV